ncbi:MULTISPECIES: hypothetical protein [unclassified Methanoregula]|uniref:hypothetical protein n=1 Tax=unclassified Methanoregula TaxID=2649730 RepID=UPI0009CA9982|nr:MULTISPECIES: hypothetical protein [unclassified Methanoregula]OPX63262.1 MAG: hypothetical protein A4E33_01769 [Methanoregula sp. PtaB.Bin085]OPY34992.1 MAG: hypothetical protein A4E34_01102 [Methanoregula sp. PtaU1.Bin006]
MKYLAVSILVIAGVLLAGCTGTQQLPPATPVPTATAAPGMSTLPPTTSPPSFTLGDHYLQKSYSLHSETEAVTEQFRVDNPSWGIGFKVLPLSDDLQSCWFEMTITNLDTNRNETFGYGRDKSFELYQQYPMYNPGPYRLTLRGNRVKVDVTAAKRNP